MGVNRPSLKGDSVNRRPKKISRRKENRYLVFLPAYNEEASIGATINAIRKYHPDVDILVVDDGSHDTTSFVAKTHGATVLRLPVNVGVGGAIRCAFRYALDNDYESAYQVDADGQHNPKYLSDLMLKVESGADLVIGTRFGGSHRYPMSLTRRLTIKIISAVLYLFTKCVYTDPTSGFRGFSSKAISELYPNFPTEYLGDTIQSLMLAHYMELKTTEVQVEMQARQGGIPSSGPFKSVGHLLRALFAIFVSQLRHLVSR